MKTLGLLGLLCLFGSGLMADPIEAKPMPSVTARLEARTNTVQVGADVDIVLRMTATADAPDVTAELVPSQEVQIVSGPVQWTGALTAGAAVAIPFRVRVLGMGDYTFGALVTNRVGARTETSGAVLYVTTTGSTAELSTTDHFTRRLARAVTAQDRLALGVMTPDPPPPPRDDREVRAVTGTLQGTVRWTDPEGNTHPVRGALVQIRDGGTTGLLITNAVTGPSGQYSVSITAGTNQVTVVVYTVDDAYDPVAGYGAKVRVHPEGQSGFYFMFVGPVAMTANRTVDLTAPRTQRGTPTRPDSTPDTNTWRAFSVFDATRTYWHQGADLLGQNPPPLRVDFPALGCSPASCFVPSPAPGRLLILHGDAYDWDVLGHEFMHFLTYTFSHPPAASGRVIDNNPGGNHSGGTAIGQPPGNGLAPRNREQGMRLAWSEGLATTLSLMLQQAPLATVSPFPTSLLNINNGRYNDTEDTSIVVNPETPSPNDGFGSENSVMGVLWDVFDTVQDSAGAVTDNVSGVGPLLLWDAITTLLPCDPCDRIDRLWSSLLTFFHLPSESAVRTAFIDPMLFEIAKPFAINNVAPRATAPANGSSFNDTPPTFRWEANGDPSSLHRNNLFTLMLSRDNFQTNRTAWHPSYGATQYTPTQAEWSALRQGTSGAASYQWFVYGQATDVGPGNPTTPDVPWFSNLMTFSASSQQTAACSTAQIAGGDAPDTRTIELGKTPATFRFDYETYGVADRMIVRHDGATLFDTGCVSTSAPRTMTLNFSGGSSRVTVEVMPNCAGSSGTQWTYTVNCPVP